MRFAWSRTITTTCPASKSREISLYRRSPLRWMVLFGISMSWIEHCTSLWKWVRSSIMWAVSGATSTMKSRRSKKSPRKTLSRPRYWPIRLKYIFPCDSIGEMVNGRLWDLWISTFGWTREAMRCWLVLIHTRIDSRRSALEIQFIAACFPRD